MLDIPVLSDENQYFWMNTQYKCFLVDDPGSMLILLRFYRTLNDTSSRGRLYLAGRANQKFL
ncbi:MAG: hypothetical protein A2161_04235 [Candidatus Schekmanbacteria bacterium RBG_13_48_7]|uniref:Uncharacterized protein n=1 Tax=Candidatus Schekmanbacteria bacterium RBG_13_48_7 TaxID=1817878 RepID=A0A1F7RMH3_9BACT|nr:MAG: hypothetical protein A2161_04235 [Candidatus Schekmanbacteria bacterium RBG_13_48_7]